MDIKCTEYPILREQSFKAHANLETKRNKYIQKKYMPISQIYIDFVLSL